MGQENQFNRGDRVEEESNYYGIGTVQHLNGDLMPDGSGRYYDWTGYVCVEFDCEIDGKKPFFWCEERKLHRLTDGGEK